MATYRYLCRFPHRFIGSRLFSSMSKKKGLVLGVYSNENEDKIKLTSYAEKYNEETSGDLLKKINIAAPIKIGDCKIFWDIGQHSAVAVAGLGNASSWSPLERMNGEKENVRIATGVAARTLLRQKITDIEVEDMGDAQNAAIGAYLATYKYQDQKSEDKKTPNAKLELAGNSQCSSEWNTGVIIAESQNFVRTLMETPANIMTPKKFAEVVTEELSKDGVECIPHDKSWAESLGMNSYLSVSKGSAEPPVFLELTYNGAGDKPFVCLVGKGITFDSGGISIKPSASMDLMRADMGGAACVSGTIRTLAKLKAPVNVKGLIPLCENMPSGTANKPGDVVRAMNGKSICIDNTDAEGRLILADALCYSGKFNPKFVVDIATLTGAIKVALGDCLVGVFTNNDDIWEKLDCAGSETGDRVWRMPLLKHYTTLVTEYDGHDLNNIGKGKGGGSCTAAAFLREFVPKDTPWAHMDMASVMGDCSDQTYTGAKGMSGRPMRTLVEFIMRAAQ